MRNKISISNKLDRIDSEIRKLNYTIGVNDRDNSYQHLNYIKELLSDINTFLNLETQE